MKSILFSLLLFNFISAKAQNVACENMVSGCPSSGMTMSLNSGTTAAPGSNYGCLATQPNPSWIFLKIINSGELIMSLSAPSDIDFIMYGPFSSDGNAVAGCGIFGDGAAGSNIVDCSYSSTNNESPEIGSNSSGGATTAIAGEVYVLLITNYSGQVQNATLSQTGGFAITGNCGNSPTCNTTAGTFKKFKNGALINSNLIPLCTGDSFVIESNIDFQLPTDTIPSPIGDGFYSAQIMWLVYDQEPYTNSGIIIDPFSDPGFTGVANIISTTNISGTNTITDQLLQSIGGCGTYYFVPVTGDDGVGGNNNTANNTNDNGEVYWDTDNNNCYSFGEVIEVRFGCETSFGASANITNSSCSICTDGEIDLNVTDQSGFNSPFIYEWSNGASTEDINSLTPGIYSVNIISINGCDSSFSFEIGDNFASINDTKLQPTITPNPNNGVFNINNLNETHEITITDVIGNVIDLSQNYNQAKYNLQFLENGLYFIQIKYKDGSYTTIKVIIRK